MLKTLNNFGVRWLTRVLQVAWKTGDIPNQWRTSMWIPIYKKRDKKCTNYWEISFLILHGRVYAKCRKKKCPKIVETQPQDA